MSDRPTPRSYKSRTTLVIVGVVFAIGFSSLALWLHLTNPASYASTPYANVEAESGGLSAPASVQANAAASGGKDVQFGNGQLQTPHIMVFVMENLSYSDVIGKSSAPYMNSLAKNYETATNSYALGHYSLDNYLGAISGNFYNWSTGDCTPGSSCRTSDTTFANQLDSAHIPWDAYMEGMPSNCYTSNAGGSGGYGVRHDPFVYFTDLESNDCSKIQPSTGMLTALNSSSPPDFVWYTPDICHDAGGDSSCATLANGDQYLSSEIPSIQATSWYKNGGKIIVTFDEGDGSGQGEFLTGNGSHVLTILISAATAGKPAYTPYVNLFGMLAGLEKAYNVACLAQACNANSGVMPL